MKLKYEIYKLPTDPSLYIDYLYDTWYYAQEYFKFSDYKKAWTGEVELKTTDEIALMRACKRILNTHNEEDNPEVTCYIDVSDVIKLNEQYFYCNENSFKNVTDIVNKK